MSLVITSTLSGAIVGIVRSIVTRRPARITAWLFFGLMVAIVIASGEASELPDLGNYRLGYYDGTGLRTNEFGYRVLVVVARSAGWSFEVFRAVVICAGLLLLHTASLKLTHRTDLFLPLYLLYPFFLDLIQFRNLLVVGFLIWALISLSGQGRWSTTLFIVFILLGASVHTIAWLYLPLVFFKHNMSRRQICTIFLFSTLAIILAFASPTNFSVLSQAMIWVDQRLVYYTSISTQMGALIPWGIWLIGLVGVWYAHKQLRPGGRFEDGVLVSQSRQFGLLVLRLNILGSLYLPLMILSGDYNRLTRNLIPLNFLALLILIEARSSHRVSSTALRVLICLVAIGLFLFQIYWPYSEVILDPILQEFR